LSSRLFQRGLKRSSSLDLIGDYKQCYRPSGEVEHCRFVGWLKYETRISLFVGSWHHTRGHYHYYPIHTLQANCLTDQEGVDIESSNLGRDVVIHERLNVALCAPLLTSPFYIMYPSFPIHRRLLLLSSSSFPRNVTLCRKQEYRDDVEPFVFLAMDISLSSIRTRRRKTNNMVGRPPYVPTTTACCLRIPFVNLLAWYIPKKEKEKKRLSPK